MDTKKNLPIRVAINGYGRIGRSVLRALYESEHKKNSLLKFVYFLYKNKINNNTQLELFNFDFELIISVTKHLPYLLKMIIYKIFKWVKQKLLWKPKFKYLDDMIISTFKWLKKLKKNSSSI